MADERHKKQVMKALECCMADEPFSECARCPYVGSIDRDGGIITCEREAMMADALALLKAERPRIITAEDFKENPMVDEHGFLPAWCECDEVETERGELVGVISKGETLDGWTEVSLDDMPGRPGHNPHVRYWTGRPGKELMGKVKWG